MDYGPWGHKELDMTEGLSTNTHLTHIYPSESWRFKIQGKLPQGYLSLA